jgi:Predicted unsaturated glucuronyl hydrolase involved in regulation of bacterial surface properties, and related proteins
MKRLIYLVFLLISLNGSAQELPYSQQLALTAMHIWPDSFSVVPGRPARWSYDQGVILKGIEGIWLATGDAKWFRYIQHSMDHYVREDGSIKDYNPEHYNIDHINNGKLLLTLYRVTGKEKYKKAVQLLRKQLLTHPRTNEGGFWHKKIYPFQMWLDGLYMGQPFYAEYAQVFGEDTIFNDVARQFVLMEKHSRDDKTGLLYHGYDESRQQRWADKVTGRSPHFWGRALGWFGMAMVDVLDYFPMEHPGRKQIIDILNRFATAVVKVQDAHTGMWYDIVDLPHRAPNYLESSATAMLAYTLAKASRKGYIAESYRAHAQKAFEGLVKYKLSKSADGFTNLEGTVSVSGLGGNPYRDGSFEYYMSEKVVQNDPKGMGAFILAANEIEMIPNLSQGKGKTILLDNFFNNEWKAGPSGKPEPWHYIWEERGNNGYFFWGSIFEQHGAAISTLKAAPSAANLKKAAVCIIVDPDTDRETAHPNYMTPAYATIIANWVKAGGVLVVMGNNSVNAEQEKINLLLQKFGIRFKGDDQLMVKGNNYDEGKVDIDANHPIFKTARNVFLKEVTSLQITPPAKSILRTKDFDIMASAKYGKGTVFVVGDPWIYNEYVDGRKLPSKYENYAAAKDLVKWLLSNTRRM